MSRHEALEQAQAATPTNASAQRLRVDTHKWQAERLNHEDYDPPQQQVNVGVQIGAAWLDALRAIKAEDAEIIQDPPAEP